MTHSRKPMENPLQATRRTYSGPEAPQPDVAERELIYLAALAQTGRPVEACRVAGVSASWPLRRCKANPEFARKQALARAALHAQIEDAQVAALLDGDEHETLGPGGEVVSLRRPAPSALRLKYVERFCGWGGSGEEEHTQAKELVILGADGKDQGSMADLVARELARAEAAAAADDEQEEDRAREGTDPGGAAGVPS